jgi:hypothetical protein
MVQTAELDELIDEVGKETEAQCELLREHLESARTYLVGAMPSEYALSLRTAQEVLNCISSKDLQKRLDEFIRSQI